MIEMKEKPFINENSLDEVYEIREKIGDGHFADVNLCVCRKSNKKFAAKFIMKQKLSAFNTYGEYNKGTSLANIDREAFILANLRHENIVKLHEVFHRNDSVVLILDLVTGGELFARVAECERLSEEEASNFVEQILYGVQHMHSLGVVHLDLKPENIMIEDLASRKIKIIDFGLARVLNPNETFQDMAGTPEFCAPEIVNYDSITFATDMWAIGVITYILLTGISPFAGDSQMETFQNILDCVVDYNREEIRDVTELAKDFIHRLLVRNPRLSGLKFQPCDSVQKNCRRGSVIRKQNLDGLKHFIAQYPSPPSSPANLLPNSEKQLDIFFQDVQSQSTQLGLECNNESGLDRVESQNNRPEHRREKRSRRKVSHERNSHNDDVVKLIIPEEILPATDEQSASRTLSNVEQNGENDKDISRLDAQLPLAQTHSTSDTPAKQSLPAASNNKGHSGGWRSNFSNRLIGRLGAAFAAATTTTHSSSQATGGLDVGSKSGQSRMNHIIKPKEMTTAEVSVSGNPFSTDVDKVSVLQGHCVHVRTASRSLLLEVNKPVICTL
ncbi:Death-associated protein kinase 1 [Paragonimus heterotremus]|uniref:Death-associated protein kinase 1 n=1 Tax=Paragonimus heterotremus TaxID=100268 RepID=A0A8J4WVB0_9TREM|nr:Death-associated protein kinase 1 [Paragonimus heterotremus]